MNNLKYIYLIIGLIVGLGLGYVLFDNTASERTVTETKLAPVEHEDEEEVVSLTQEEIDELGIKTTSASSGQLNKSTTLAGEIAIDPIWVSHLKPRYTGVVEAIKTNIGDKVKKGDTLAIIEANESLVKFPLLSSVEGTVIDIHMSPGEVKGDDEHAIEVANLNHVWAIMTVYQKDLRDIKVGQKAFVYDKQSGIDYSGKINFINPIVNEATRTASARIELNNKKREWLPGMFVNADLITTTKKVPIMVNKNAVQTYEGESVVFIKDDHGFEPQKVTLGISDLQNIEILSGLTKGQEYIYRGAFTIKAELLKASFGGGHSH